MKKNRTLTIFFMILIVGAYRVQAQTSESKFYIKAYGGYGFITPGSFRLQSTSYDDTGNKGTTSESKKGMGSGIRAGGGIGVIVNDFLNIGVDAEYLSGSKISSNSSYNYGTLTQSTTVDLKYTCVSITPNVIFKALSKPDYLIYNKLGILLNMPFDLKRTQIDTGHNSAVLYSSKSTAEGAYKIGLTVGVNVALGAQMRLTDKLRLFGEIFGNFLVLTPKSYSETSVTTNTNDITTTKVTSTSNTTFIKEGQVSYSSTSNTDADGNTVNTNTNVQSVSGNRFTMNAIGINIGIAIRF